MESPKPNNEPPKEMNGTKPTPAVTVKRDVIPIQTAIAIGIALVTAVATFFATRADLVGRLNRVDTRIEALDKRLAQVKIQHYLERTKVYTQITNLRIVEAELERLESYVARWKPATLKYGKKPPFARRPLEHEVVIDARSFEGGSPKGYDQSLLGNVVTSVDTRGIPDTEIMPRLHQVVLRLGKYNSHLSVLRIGALKRDAEDGNKERGNDIGYIKNMLPGLKQKVIDCRHEVESILKK